MTASSCPRRRFLGTLLAMGALVACLRPIHPGGPTPVDRICNALCRRQAECPAGGGAARAPDDGASALRTRSTPGDGGLAAGADAPSLEAAQACQTQCREFGSRLRAYWRDDYVDTATHCLETSSCSVLQVPREVDAKCFVATLPEPTPLAHQACKAMVEKDRECVLGAVPGEDECLRYWGALGERTLERLLACEKLPCGNHLRRNCVEQSLGG